MKDTLLARFTPSLMSAEALETLFVQRHELAARTVELVRERVLEGGSTHTLLVGPRGIGKTHLVSLVYHRLRAQADLQERLLIAWLREEEWGVTSFLDLLLRILPALVADSQEPAAREQVERLYELEPAAATRAALQLLAERVSGRALLLIVENLDALFDGLGLHGQQQLRAYLQEHPNTLLLATAQSLFAGVSRQRSPFYGFFRVHQLEELSLDGAAQLLVNIARFDGRDDLAASIPTPAGRARLRALHHLGGGNPRVYVIFSQFLTRASLDDLVEPVLRTLDDLTPYYQGRMSALSPQQRKIVALLCDVRQALTVREIAQRCFASQQTASSQLRLLRELGYVQARPIGRESYYDLREPLLRLCLDVKKARAQPVRLLVEFLRVWYSRDELLRHANAEDSGGPLARAYALRALQLHEREGGDPVAVACREDCSLAIKRGDFDAALQAVEELIVRRGTVDDWCEKAHCLSHLRRWQELLAVAERALEIDPGCAQAWQYKGEALQYLRHLNEARQCFVKATELEPGQASALCWLAYIELQASQWHGAGLEKARGWLERATELDPKHAWTWTQLSRVLGELGRHEESLAAAERAVTRDRSDPRAWAAKGSALVRLGRHDETVTPVRQLTRLALRNDGALDHLVALLLQLEQRDKALAVLDRVSREQPSHVAWFNKAMVLNRLDRPAEALEAARQATASKAECTLSWHEQGLALLRLHRFVDAADALDRAATLGDTRPELLGERAVARVGMGNWEEGLSLLRDLDPARLTPETLVAFLEGLLQTAPRGGSLKDAVDHLAVLCEGHEAMARLAEALVRATASANRDAVTDATLSEWRNAWRATGTQRPELRVALRLVEAIVGYRESRDERVLMALPAEERALVEPLLVPASEEEQPAGAVPGSPKDAAGVRSQRTPARTRRSSRPRRRKAPAA